jgi:quercetin dioxygenase-like cupin family protein
MSEPTGGELRHVAHSASNPVEMQPGVVRRTLGWGERMLLAEISLRKGSGVPAHSHPHEQIGYLAKGKLEFTVGGEKIVVSAGDGYTIPGGVTHGAVALEDALAIEVFSPVRDEFK